MAFAAYECMRPKRLRAASAADAGLGLHCSDGLRPQNVGAQLFQKSLSRFSSHQRLRRVNRRNPPIQAAKKDGPDRGKK